MNELNNTNKTEIKKGDVITQIITRKNLFTDGTTEDINTFTVVGTRKSQSGLLIKVVAPDGNLKFPATIRDFEPTLERGVVSNRFYLGGN